MNGYKERNELLVEMGFKDYAAYLRSQRWKGIRLGVLNRDSASCIVCRRRANQVHHRSYASEVLLGEDTGPLVSICDGCHHTIEFCNGKKLANPTAVESRLCGLLAGKHGCDLPGGRVSKGKAKTKARKRAKSKCRARPTHVCHFCGVRKGKKGKLIEGKCSKCRHQRRTRKLPKEELEACKVAARKRNKVLADQRAERRNRRRLVTTQPLEKT